MHRLNTFISALLMRWYFGPDHIGKIRMWEKVLFALGNPRLTIPYQGEALISVDIHDWVQKKIVEEGVYEPEVWEALAEHADEDEIVWDIGGHIGSVSIRAALHPAVRAVHAFEPHPRTFEVLSTNVQLNPELPITAHNIALSNQQGKQDLYEGPSINSGQASLNRSFGSGAVKVDCTTVDQLVRNQEIPSPTLVKMDVEGWEANVLEGAEWLLEHRPPRAFAFEGEEPSTSEGISDTEVVDFFREAGYTVSRIPRSQNVDHDVDNYLAIQTV